MLITNVHDLPDPLYRALTADEYDLGEADISVTRLVGPPRITQLLKRHGDKIESDASDGFWIFLGKMAHYAIEKAGMEGVQEERISFNMDGWNIVGTPDCIIEDTLTDWKVTSVYSYLLGLKPEWTSQLNVYRKLLKENGTDISTLQVWAILRDWRRSEAQKNNDYPEIPFQRINVPVWPSNEVEDYLHERIAMHQAAEEMSDDDLPLCTPEERWQRAPVWAVFKDKNKRATKLFKSKDFDNPEEEAMAFAKRLKLVGSTPKIEYREGKPIRCGFCAVRRFCSQYAEETK